MPCIRAKGTALHMARSSWISPIILGIAVLGLWHSATSLHIIDTYALPAPYDVAHELIRGISEGYLLTALGTTLSEALYGCLTAAIIGIPAGFAIAHNPLLSYALEPFLAASQAIPAIALAPLLVMWVGYGTAPIVVLCTIMVVFPVIIATAVGVRSVSSELIGAAKLDGAHGRILVTSIELPLAGPHILAGLRTGFTLAVTGAVVGEMVIGGDKGLGIQLVASQHMNATAPLFASIILLASAAVAIYTVIKALEHKVFELVSY